MNFVTEFEKGQKGENKGIPLGKGFENLSRLINGLQKARIYTVAGGPKSGKSTLTDAAFVVQTLLFAKENNIPMEVIYYSLEIDRISKEFDFCSYFMYNDYNIEFVDLPVGITKNGKATMPISPDYLRGRVQDDEGNVIKVNEEILEKVKAIYNNRIITFFGSYDKSGKKLAPGLINVIENKNNPTGFWKDILAHAKLNGAFTTETWKASDGTTGERMTGYIENNPQKITLVVTDHCRKLSLERGYNMKQNVDKFSEFCVDLRNLIKYSFINIIHTNRSLADIATLKFAGSNIYPGPESIKESGNLSEDSDYVLTIFNPNDDKYNLDKHFDLVLKDSQKRELYPFLRTIHLVESRHCDFPQHFKTNMHGNIKTFKQFKE